MIFIAYEQYMHTGDSELLVKHYDRLRFLTLIDLIGSDGLVSTVEPPLSADFIKEAMVGLKDNVDWPVCERDGYDMVPINTVVNAFVFQGLVYMAKIASVVGKIDDAAVLSDAAAKLKKSMLEQLIDPTTLLFVDGKGSNHSAAHSTFFPLAFGLLEGESVGVALKYLRTRIDAYEGGFPCSVYGAQFLLQALFEYSGDEIAYTLLRNRSVRSWFNMIDKGGTITWEAWDQVYKPNQDWNHAWVSSY
jgi:alpha-L-rhamnosidase